ncbi:MAG: InlB B-repeat-containing protein, partial [Clostridia bacterium]|nr:InlB B-repeat-containing protein [Clostridia bacterium]
MKSLTKKQSRTLLITVGSVLLALILVLSGVGIYFKISHKEKTPPAEINPLDFSVDTWDGTVSASSFNEGYAGRSVKTKTINSASAFAHFINEVNNGNSFEGYTVYLNSNIDFKNKKIDPIGTQTNPFKGTFDGGHYTLLNANINGTALFENTENATIKNVGLYNSNASLINIAVNTNIENTYVRLGEGKLVEEYISNNGKHEIKNSFVDNEGTGFVGKLSTDDSQENEVTISNCYFTTWDNAILERVGECFVVENKVINPTTKTFADWSYSKDYSTTVDWCDYDYREGSQQLDFKYPLQSGFVKVFLTGSCYESVVVAGSTVLDATNLPEAFKEANKEEEAEINLLVEKVFMEARAEVSNNTVVTINTMKDSTIVRGENNEDSLFVATGNSKIILGESKDEVSTSSTSQDKKDILTLDGNREYFEQNELESGALVVSYGGYVELNNNVVIKDNINNTTKNGGAVLVYNSPEVPKIDATFENCSSEENGGGVAIVGTPVEEIGASFYGCSAKGNGGALYVGEISQSSISAMRTLYGKGLAVQPTSYNDNHFVNGSGASVKITNDAVYSNCTAGGDAYGDPIAYGGAISIYGTVYISGNPSFCNNEVSDSGGAIYCLDLVVTGSPTFESNRAAYKGGAICVEGPDAGLGCVFTATSKALFMYNEAQYGGGIYSTAQAVIAGDLEFSVNSGFCPDGADIPISKGIDICVEGDVDLIITGSPTFSQGYPYYGSSIYLFESYTNIDRAGDVYIFGNPQITDYFVAWQEEDQMTCIDATTGRVILDKCEMYYFPSGLGYTVAGAGELNWSDFELNMTFMLPEMPGEGMTEYVLLKESGLKTISFPVGGKLPGSTSNMNVPTMVPIYCELVGSGDTITITVKDIETNGATYSDVVTTASASGSSPCSLMIGAYDELDPSASIFVGNVNLITNNSWFGELTFSACTDYNENYNNVLFKHNYLAISAQDVIFKNNSDAVFENNVADNGPYGAIRATNITIAGSPVFHDSPIFAAANILISGNPEIRSEIRCEEISISGNPSIYVPIYATDITIDGSPSFDGQSSFRAIQTENITINGNPTFSNCYARGAGTGGYGGAIYASGDVEITGDATFTGNSAEGSGGAIYASGDVEITGDATFTGFNSAGEKGGAIYASGDVDISGDCEFTGSFANEGAQIYTTGNLTISGNTGFYGDGEMNGVAITVGGDLEFTSTCDVKFEYGMDTYATSLVEVAGTTFILGDVDFGGEYGIVLMGNDIEGILVSNHVEITGNVRFYNCYTNGGNCGGICANGSVTISGTATFDQCSGPYYADAIFLNGENSNLTIGSSGTLNISNSNNIAVFGNGGSQSVYIDGAVNFTNVKCGFMSMNNISLTSSPTFTDVTNGVFDATNNITISGNPTFNNCGIAVWSQGDVIISGNPTFSNCKSGNGTIDASGDVIITGNPIFNNNSSTSSSTYLSGGILANNVIITGAPTFTGNSSTKSGGAISARGDVTITEPMTYMGPDDQIDIEWDDDISTVEFNFMLFSNAYTCLINSVDGNYHGIYVTNGYLTSFGGQTSKQLPLFTPLKLIANYSPDSYYDHTKGEVVVESPHVFTVVDVATNGKMFSDSFSVYSDPYGAFLCKCLYSIGPWHEHAPIMIGDVKIDDAIYLPSSQLESVPTFTGNTATGNGGAIGAAGDVNICADSLFEQNTAPDNGGGAIYARGDVTISGDVTFTSNEAEEGGAIYSYKNVTISGSSTFSCNEAYEGGAIYTNNADVIISGDAEFAENDVEECGGAILSCENVIISGNPTFSDNTAGGDGGAISALSNITITGAPTFTGNTATRNGGAIDGSLTVTSTGNATFRNNIAGEEQSAVCGSINVAGEALFEGNESSISVVAGANITGTAIFRNNTVGDATIWKGATLNGGSMTFEGNNAAYGEICGDFFYYGGTFECDNAYAIELEEDELITLHAPMEGNIGIHACKAWVLESEDPEYFANGGTLDLVYDATGTLTSLPFYLAGSAENTELNFNLIKPHYGVIAKERQTANMWFSEETLTMGYTETKTINYSFDVNGTVIINGVAGKIEIFENGTTKTTKTHAVTADHTYEIVVKGTNVGGHNLEFVFQPTDLGVYKATTTAVTTNVTPKSIALPTASSKTFKYDGTEKTYLPANWNTISAYVDISNNVRYNIGSQSVNFSLKDTENYCWADGTITDKQLSFTIGAGKLSAPTNLAVNGWVLSWDEVKLAGVNVSYKVEIYDYPQMESSVVFETNDTYFNFETVKHSLPNLKPGLCGYEVYVGAISNNVELAISSANTMMSALQVGVVGINCGTGIAGVVINGDVVDSMCAVGMYKGTIDFFENGEATTCTISAILEEEYRFAGWATDSSSISFEDMSAVQTQVTFTVNMLFSGSITASAIPEGVTVTFNGNGGNVEYTSKVYNTENETYETLPMAIRTGYTFNGWKLGGSVVTIDSTLPLEDHTLVADWTAKQFTVTLNANGSLWYDVLSTTQTITVTYGLPYPSELISLASSMMDYDPSKYLGWFTSATGGIEITTETIVTAIADHTLYAHWDNTIFAGLEYIPSTYGFVRFANSSEPLNGWINFNANDIIHISGNVLTIGNVHLVAIPNKSTPQYSYEFVGWGMIDGDEIRHYMFLAPQFRRVERSYNV